MIYSTLHIIYTFVYFQHDQIFNKFVIQSWSSAVHSHATATKQTLSCHTRWKRSVQLNEQLLQTRSCCDVLHGVWCIFKISHENVSIRHRHFVRAENWSSSPWSDDPDSTSLGKITSTGTDRCSQLMSNVLQSRVYHRFVIHPWNFKFWTKYCSCWCFSTIKYIMESLIDTVNHRSYQWLARCCRRLLGRQFLRRHDHCWQLAVAHEHLVLCLKNVKCLCEWPHDWNTFIEEIQLWPLNSSYVKLVLLPWPLSLLHWSVTNIFACMSIVYRRNSQRNVNINIEWRQNTAGNHSISM